MKYELAVFGHIVLDHVSRNGPVRGPQLGGPCTYAGLAANALDAKTIAASKVGSDLGNKRLSWLLSHGISTSHIQVTGSETTRFEINYRNENRTIRVISLCASLDDKGLSRLPPSSAIHICPVLNEIPLSLANQLTKGDSMVGLDPQGYLRQLGSEGKVRLRRFTAHQLLKRIGVLKTSEGEFPATSGGNWWIKRLKSLGPDIVLLTRGRLGVIVWSRENGLFNIPAYPTIVRDPTGAGDALAGAFLVTWTRTWDMLWSAAVGVAVASFVVARTGHGDFGTRKQIERRALKVLEETTRI